MQQNTEALPVSQYREIILAALAANPVTIVTAATGAGKSTQVPQYLAAAGYRVVCTQPRRLAARSLAQRVAEEMKTRLGDRVGYRTGEDRADSAATEILFVTDGLQLVRELTGAGAGRRTVLVLDEVHEWNLNVETLVAWARQRVQAGDDLKVVLMSATLDAGRLAEFFGGAPVIDVPGRLYPVTERVSSSDTASEAARLAQAGHNVLVFEAGKAEIAQTIETLEGAMRGRPCTILPLHGGLEPTEQARCFAPSAFGPKIIVATNVAQTSVTVPDIDAVVDSCMERRVELSDGIEGLYLRPISVADRKQRAGRAGRTKPGQYVACGPMATTEYPVPDIHRVRLDQLVLRLAAQGFDATALSFFHQPKVETLRHAHDELEMLGALVNGQVTGLGRQMAKMPVGVRMAAMLCAAKDRGVVEPVATIAAILEAGDLRARDGEWRRYVGGEQQSDLIALLNLFRAGCEAKGGGDALRAMGIFAKDFYRARDVRKKLLDLMGESTAPVKVLGDRNREKVVECIVAGMLPSLTCIGNSARRVDDQSVTQRSVDYETLIVAQPRDIQTNRGRVIELWSLVTVVTPELLNRVLPGTVQQVETDVVVDPHARGFRVTLRSIVRGRPYGFHEQKTVTEHPRGAEVFRRWVLDGCHGSPWNNAVKCYGLARTASEREIELRTKAGQPNSVDFRGWWAKQVEHVQSWEDLDALDVTWPEADLPILNPMERTELGNGNVYTMLWASIQKYWYIQCPQDASADEMLRTVRRFEATLPDTADVRVYCRFGHGLSFDQVKAAALREAEKAAEELERTQRLEGVRASLARLKDEHAVVIGEMTAEGMPAADIRAAGWTHPFEEPWGSDPVMFERKLEETIAWARDFRERLAKWREQRAAEANSLAAFPEDWHDRAPVKVLSCILQVCAKVIEVRGEAGLRAVAEKLRYDKPNRAMSMQVMYDAVGEIVDQDVWAPIAYHDRNVYIALLVLWVDATYGHGEDLFTHPPTPPPTWHRKFAEPAPAPAPAQEIEQVASPKANLATANLGGLFGGAIRSQK